LQSKSGLQSKRKLLKDLPNPAQTTVYQYCWYEI
jgi:hypothetical protein